MRMSCTPPPGRQHLQRQGTDLRHGLSRIHSLRSNSTPIFLIEIFQVISLMALRIVGRCPEHWKNTFDALPGLDTMRHESWRTKFWCRLGSTSLGRVLENASVVGWTRTIPIQAVTGFIYSIALSRTSSITSSGSGIYTNSTKWNRAWRNFWCKQ